MPSAAELRELDDEELEDRLGEYRKELLNLRFQMATGQLDNPSRIGQVRRDVARVLTLLRDREIAEAEGRAPTTGRARPAVAEEEPPARRTGRSRKAGAEEEFETEDVVRADAAEAEEDEAGAELAGEDGEDA